MCVLVLTCFNISFVGSEDQRKKTLLTPKIGFVAGVTILLSLTVFLNLVAETLPQVSDAIPLLGWAPSVFLSLFLFLSLFIFISVLLFYFFFYIHLYYWYSSISKAIFIILFFLYFDLYLCVNDDCWLFSYGTWFVEDKCFFPAIPYYYVLLVSWLATYCKSFWLNHETSLSHLIYNCFIKNCIIILKLHLKHMI